MHSLEASQENKSGPIRKSMGKEGQSDTELRPSCPNVEDELRAICIPCKNSSLNYIKVMCEKALLSFRHYRDVIYKTDYDENGERFKRFPVTDICSVCREAIIASTKNSDSMQLSILGMNCIQQILIPGLLDTSHKITILAVLNEVTLKVSATIKIKSKQTSSNYHGNHSSLNNDKEQVLLKVIQTVLLFLSPEILEFNEAMITLIVSIVSTLFNLSGYYQLIQMSQLAIRQLINISLDYIDSNSANEEDSKDVSEVVSLLLIKDISIMIDKNTVENVKLVSNNKNSKDNLTPLSLLKGGITIPSEICLDLWYEILDKNISGRRSLLENNEDLRNLIHNILFPTLTKCIQNSCLELNPKMSQNIHEFVMFARFIRLFVKILEFNSSKKLQGPFIKDCICNSLMSFIEAISDLNYLNIPSWSLQCILEMLSELVQNPDILIIIGNYNVKVPNKEKETTEEPKTTNILELIISTINQILVSLNDQLDILYSAENTLNLSVPSFLNEKISLPSILLPQHNNTSIECGYFIISSSKKTSEKNLRLIDVIMEDDRIYHISKYYFGGNMSSSGGATHLHAGNMQSLSNLSSVVLISLKPIEISLLVFDIILNISTCLNRIYLDQINGDREKTIEFEKLVFNIWDQFYILIKQCMDYYLLRYYVYRIITFLFMISNLPEFKGKLSNILELIFESLQKYYKNNPILESRILNDTIMLEKLFSIYKCFLSISYQFSECLDEVSWQLLFRYMEYIDRILDIGLGPMIKSNEIKSKSTIEVGDLEELDQSLLSLKSEHCLSIENGESIEMINNIKAKDEKIRDGQIIKTLMAESTILRASHQVFLKDHIKNISENTMNCVIKGIYKELSYNMYKENLDIQVFDYMLKQLSCIIQSIYDKMSYNLFIPIWNDKIIPLLLETIKQNNYCRTGIACAQNQYTCDLQNCMHTDNNCPHEKNNDVEINKKVIRNNLENVEMFNSIMNFLSSTITTIFQFVDEDNSILMENNVQTSLLNPYLMLNRSFPMYNTLLLRSLYSIMCSTIPKLDDSTWILINVLINNIIQERYCRYIKYLKYEKSESNENIVINGSLSFLESTSAESLNYENNQIDGVNIDIDYDIELLQAIFSLIEYISDEAEIRFLGNTNKISSSWNLLVESIAVFGRVNISTENMAFQAVSLLWKLTDLLGASLSKHSQEIENESEKDFNQRFDYELNIDKDNNPILVFDQRNVKINMNKINKVYYSDYTSIDIIWLNIILQLEDLCKDPRQEIRNCSLKSLFSALITHCKYIKNQILKSIIIRILGNVLTVSIEQYNNSYKETNYEKLQNFDSLSKDDHEYNETASLSLSIKDSVYFNYNSMNSSLEFEKTILDSQNHDSNLNKINKQDDFPSLSTSFIRNSQQNKLWEETLVISIDGTLRVIKELSQNNALKNQESQNICYECIMFLYNIISSLLSFKNKFHENSAGFENHQVITYTKDIQITSIKTLYELLVVSMKIGNNHLWNSGFNIYKEIIDRIIIQSAETLRKLQRAEEFIHKSNQGTYKDDSIYKLYNNYVHKLIKFHLSDKLAESLLQSVVDLLILIKNEGNMAKYIIFDESFTQMTLLLDLIISIITSTNTFIHHTVPLSNLNYPESPDNFQNIFEETTKKQFIDQRSKQGLYRKFCEYYKNLYEKNQSDQTLFLPSLSSHCGIWGRDMEDSSSLLYIPKLVNFEKDHQETVLSSYKDSNHHGKGLNRLIYIYNYNNSDFIHGNSFKKVGGISLSKVKYQERNDQLFNQIEKNSNFNIVYLLRNINNFDMFRPEANYCYYVESKKSYKDVINPMDKRINQEKSNDMGNRSYSCSIKNNNDYLSSSINGEIRFITTIQNIGMEALQFYVMSLLSFDQVESSTLEEISHKNLLIPLVIKKLLDTLVIHKDLFVDTNKIGISSKTISLLVGFNRNIILKSIEIVQLLNINQFNSIIQMIMILPYIFEKLLLIMELDKERVFGIWMVAKEALLVIMNDWISFISYLKIEFGKMNRNDLNTVKNELNQIIVENIWPLFIDIIGNMVKEEQGFGLKIVSNNILNNNSQKISNYIDNYHLYFDILLVNVVMDFISKLNESNIEDLEVLELPYKYYKIIINYFDDFLNDNNQLKNGLELKNKSHKEEHMRIISGENINFGGLNRSGNHNMAQNNNSTLNANYQTLKIYIIENLFALYDQLNIKLSSISMMIKMTSKAVNNKGEGEGGEEEEKEKEENKSQLTSKMRDLIVCIEELGDILHRMTSNMFKNFSMEDLQIGLRPMPHLKIEEIHSLLVLIEKHYIVLRRFEEENLDESSEIQLEILKMRKRCFGNYIENVLPELIECVTCKDQSIRQRLKIILSILSKDISKNYNSLLVQIKDK